MVAATVIGLGYLIVETIEPKDRTRVVESDEQRVVPFDEQQGVTSTIGAIEDTEIPLEQVSIREDAPQEIVKSVHDNDLEFRTAAESAAEQKVSMFSPESVSRWRPVRLDPESILNGDLLEPGSMPNTIKISPFPDTTYVVSETKYTIRKHTGSISWTGKISGIENGTVEIHARGSVNSPTFSIKIFDPPRFFSITPTETDDAYLAIEGNPHQPDATL